MTNPSNDTYRHAICGIKAFVELVDLLRGENVSANIVKSAQGCVESIYNHFSRAKETCETHLDELQQRIEEIAMFVGRSDQEIASIQCDIQQFSIEISRLKEEENDQREYSTGCENILKEKENSLEKAIKKLHMSKKSQKVLTGVGIGVAAIPIGGWVLGPSMIGIGVKDLDKSVKDTKGYVEDAQAGCNLVSAELAEMRYKLIDLHQEIEAKKAMMNVLELQKNNLKQQRSELMSEISKQTNMKEKLNHCFTFLSTAFGRARHLRNTTENYRTHCAVRCVLPKWDSILSYFSESRNHAEAEQIIDHHFIQPLIEPIRALAEHLLDKRRFLHLHLLEDFEDTLKKLNL